MEHHSRCRAALSASTSSRSVYDPLFSRERRQLSDQPENGEASVVRPPGKVGAARSASRSRGTEVSSSDTHPPPQREVGEASFSAGEAALRDSGNSLSSRGSRLATSRRDTTRSSFGETPGSCEPPSSRESQSRDEDAFNAKLKRQSRRTRSRSRGRSEREREAERREREGLGSREERHWRERREGREERGTERREGRRHPEGGLERLLQVAAGATAAAEEAEKARREAALLRAAEWQSRAEDTRLLRGVPRRGIVEFSPKSLDKADRPRIPGGDCPFEKRENERSDRERGAASWEVKKDLADANVKSESFHAATKREKREEQTGLTRSRNPRSFSKSPNEEHEKKHPFAWGRPSETGTGLVKDDARQGRHETEKQDALRPNFEPSGLLSEDRGENSRNGVSLKHTEPADAAMPSKKWRLYMFKNDRTKPAAEVANQEPDKTLHLHRRSSFIFGKDNRVADILLMHPTISKQHAVLQFRRKLGDVSPYIIDLESTNGTYLNGAKIETCRYYQLREQDTLRFGKSTRDFVLLHAGSVAVDLSYNSFLDSRSGGQSTED
ncbi:FHA domain-containing protein [Toxoplasma gondii TgCatPRC2]|uniref:FHA domain-containing protein n=1 Tax=Toxoplasma gondii TgCatPRC2 TaxID=1130821 RepID=A0A151HB90_TOXGO|nr:FHA domain-containing protein [Toxoplasma gondii TgCatPRC2]